MFLTVHAVAGELLARNTPSPWAAFVIGFFSHFLVDAVPHGDEMIGARTREQTVRLLSMIVILDTLCIILVQRVLWVKGLLTLPMLAAGFGAMIPDALQFPVFLLESPPVFFQAYKKTHDRFHNVLGVQLGIKWGLVLQMLTLAILVVILA